MFINYTYFNNFPYFITVIMLTKKKKKTPIDTNIILYRVEYTKSFITNEQRKRMNIFIPAFRVLYIRDFIDQLFVCS